MARNRFIIVIPYFLCFLLAGCASSFKSDVFSTASAGPAGAIGGWTDHISCRNLVVDPPTTTRELAKSENVPCEMLDNGKKYYRLGQYGLAERSYRQAIETSAGSGMALDKTAQMEMWLGLAATYDRLKRFDLADKAYDHFRTYFGRTPAYDNNYGYSLLLRGDKKNAVSHLQRADDKFLEGSE